MTLGKEKQLFEEGKKLYPNSSCLQQPTPVFLPGESHEQKRLEGYSSWGHKESDMTEQLSTHTNIYIASAITEHFPQWLR